MTDVVLISCLWVLAGTITALLPMRFQYVPGTILLVAAPFLIFWLAAEYGWWIGLIGIFALLSMFRKPLVYYYRVLRGLDVDVPE